MIPRNCINCSAPYDPHLHKCPYCGTIYYDMTDIDFNSKQPIYLTIKKDNYIITQKVLPSTVDFEHKYETVDCINSKGHKLKTFVTNNTIETNIIFTAVPDEKVLFTFEVENE